MSLSLAIALADLVDFTGRWSTHIRSIAWTTPVPGTEAIVLRKITKLADLTHNFHTLGYCISGLLRGDEDQRHKAIAEVRYHQESFEHTITEFADARDPSLVAVLKDGLSTLKAVEAALQPVAA